MRYLALLQCLLMFAGALIQANCAAPGLDGHAFDIQLVSEEKRAKLIDALQIRVTDEQHTIGFIQEFAVEDGYQKRIAIGFYDNAIDIYDADESYAYTIRYESEGACTIYWENGMLYLYIVRGDYQVELDGSGNVLNIYELVPGSDSYNHKIYQEKCTLKRVTKSNGFTYELDNNNAVTRRFAWSYSQIRIYDEEGNSHYFYRSDEFGFWAMSVIVISFVTTVVAILAKQTIRIRKERMGGNPPNAS